MDYIVFDTEAEANTATELCWVKYVKDKVAGGCRAVNSTEYTDLTGLTDAQICKLKLYGKNHQGVDVKTKGLTINYQLYVKSYSADKWFAAQPPTEYLALLSGYTVKTQQQLSDEGYYPPDQNKSRVCQPWLSPEGRVLRIICLICRAFFV